MTREKAIAFFKDMNECTYGDCEAVEMAIKALEQEPCGDCISRTQAQTELEMNACRYTLAKERGDTGKVEWDSRLIDVTDAVNIIRNLSPITVQSKTVKWIDDQESILDKIRTEIEEYKSRQLSFAMAIDVEDLEKGKQVALDYVLAIFDEYKAESEVE